MASLSNYSKTDPTRHISAIGVLCEALRNFGEWQLTITGSKEISPVEKAMLARLCVLLDIAPEKDAIAP